MSYGSQISSIRLNVKSRKRDSLSETELFAGFSCKNNRSISFLCRVDCTVKPHIYVISASTCTMINYADRNANEDARETHAAFKYLAIRREKCWKSEAHSREIRALGSVLPRETRVLFRKHPYRVRIPRCFARERMASLRANHRRARNLKSVQPVAHTFLHMKDIAEITRYVSNHDLWPNVHTRRERASRLPKVQIRVFQQRPRESLGARVNLGEKRHGTIGN